jgi:Flp pilus assembly protein TadG
MMSAWKKLRSALRTFCVAHTGNVAITFAIASVPLVGFVGAGYDYSHANAVKAELQAALDSTALMLARDASTLSNSALQTKATNYFNALYTRPETTVVSISASYSSTGGSAVTVNGSVNVPTTFLRVLGPSALQDITVNGSSTTKWGTTRLRVALALDNTGSMWSNGKMTALKAATKSLLEQLKGAATQNGDVYVSIIPFSKDVNVGSQNYNASWIDWSGWEEINGSCSHWKYTTKTDCLDAPGNRTWTANNHDTWNGCITDRGPSSAPGSSTWDQVATQPDGSTDSLWPAEQYNDCPVGMKGLSYDWTGMNNLVDSMQPDGNTNQPIGLVWAWQSLVGGGPLTAPAKDSGYTYQEVIILMSDGLNTQNRWYSSQTAVDNRMYQTGSGSGTCANIKATGITIYTIHVNTNGDPTSTLLQNCASSSDKFFLVTSANDMSNVFSNIGTNLTKLRVAK